MIADPIIQNPPLKSQVFSEAVLILVPARESFRVSSVVLGLSGAEWEAMFAKWTKSSRTVTDNLMQNR